MAKRAQDEIDDLKNEVVILKNVQRTQAQVMRARKEEWERERDALRDDNEALKEGKKKLEFDVFNLVNVRDLDKQKLKRLRARKVVLKTNTGCSWAVKLKDVKGTVCLDQGWAGFAIVHQVKIGYFLTFKMLRTDVFKVTIFDYTMTEVVQKCPRHDPALAMIDE